MSRRTVVLTHPEHGEAEVHETSVYVWEDLGWTVKEAGPEVTGGEADRQTAAGDEAPGTPLGQDPAAAGTQATQRPQPLAADAQVAQPASSTSSDRGTVTP